MIAFLKYLNGQKFRDVFFRLSIGLLARRIKKILDISELIKTARFFSRRLRF